MEIVEKNLHNLVEQSFPAFYQTDGPVFIEFVKQYYKWLETTAPSANLSVVTKGFVTVNSQSGVIVGKNTNFDFNFANGDSIAISQDSDPENYSVFVINTVSNSTYITLVEPNPDFSSTNSSYYVVVDQHNPNYYARRLLENKDVDTTAEEFIVYFKEKYLKNIQFNTQTNTRLLLKRVLDLYRSKGTPRSIDLLFKIVFGVPASVYYPGDDVFRLSDGHWYRPKYIEVSLRDTNVEMVNKQVEGLMSGATAFVEAVVRKTVKGRFIDVLYISAINGNFQTGELISCPTSTLTKHQLPTMIGSLTHLTVDDDSTGYEFEIGDIISIESVSGEGAQARVTEISNTTGVADIELLNGGYAYTANAEVIVSDKVLILNNCMTSVSFEANSYVPYDTLFDTFVQPMALVQVNQSNGLFAASANVYAYHANNLLQGFGRVISYTGNTSIGNVTVTTYTGTLDSTHLYTTANAIGANIIGFTDQSITANLFVSSSNVDIYITNTVGTWEISENVYQYDIANNYVAAQGVVKSYSVLGASNSVIAVINSYGTFKSGLTVYGETSNASSYVEYLKMYVGLTDPTGTFISSTNNYIYWANGLVNGSIYIVGEGNGAGFNISSNLLYQETVALNTDYLADFAYKPLAHEQLAGTVSVATNSNTVTGTGTAFNTLRFTVAGNVSINTSHKSVVGNGTTFTSHIINNDVIEIASNVMKVRRVVNNTFLTVNAYFNISNSQTTANVTNYLTFDNGSALYSRRIKSITNSTVLNVDSNGAFGCATANAWTSWAFPANTSANVTAPSIANCLTYVNANIGKVQSLTMLNKGVGYTIPPYIKIYEPFTATYHLKDLYHLEISGGAGDFTDGEAVTQAATSGRGEVVFANSSYMIVEKLRFKNNNEIIITSNSTTVLVGNNTGTTVNVTAVTIYSNSQLLGYNANISAPVIIANGAIVSLEVVDSGFGFRQDEPVQVTTTNVASVELSANLGSYGQGTGFYKQKGGELSNQKKLFDGMYYQDYSYEVRSSITLNRYEEMLKQLLHISGTKYFGAFIHTTIANANISAANSRITSVASDEDDSTMMLDYSVINNSGYVSVV